MKDSARGFSDLQITRRNPPTKQSRDTADNQARCSTDASLTLSDSHIGQAHLEPKFTREQVATCRKRISGDAKSKQTMRLVWLRDKTITAGIARNKQIHKGQEKNNVTHVERGEHSKPSREPKWSVSFQLSHK